MPYLITKTDGTPLATVSEGTVNTANSDLTLIGKKYAGYGTFLNENFVKLLENFADVSAPPKAIAGQLWYDKSTSILKIYNGGAWKPISSSTSKATPPTDGITTGDLWWDTTNAQLKVYNNNVWVTVGPVYTTSAGTSGALVETVVDNVGASHIVIKLYVAQTVVAIISSDLPFTPQTSITGFSTIKPGINLTTSVLGAQFVGDASNAAMVGGLLANQLMRNDQNASTSFKITAGGGFRAGSDLDIVPTTGAVNMTNITASSDINFWVNTLAGSFKALGITGANGAVTIPGDLTVTGSPTFTTPIPVASGGTGSTTATGTGPAVLRVSPALTGTPTAPTASVGTNSTQLATTAFVLANAPVAFPSGTRMIFNQTAAPTGWTKDTSVVLNDSILRIVTGVAGLGGSVAFSSFNSQTATGAHTLTTAQMPSHNHISGFSGINASGAYGIAPATGPAGNKNAQSGFTNLYMPYTSSEGGGLAHSHTMTTSIKYVDFIIASKN